MMDCDENDETYENVVFRSSRIVYPPSLAETTVAQVVSEFQQDNSRVRPSLLQAFDPIAQKSYDNTNDGLNLDLLVLSGIDFKSGESPPPPIPPRNPRYRVHQYDPVSIDDGVVELPVKSTDNHTDHSQEVTSSEASNNPPLHLPENEGSPLEFRFQSHHLRKSSVKGILEKVSSKEWLPQLKTFTSNSRIPKREQKNPTDIPIACANENLGYGGMLQWNFSSKRDSQALWTELKNHVLSAYSNPNDAPVHLIKMDKLASVGLSANSEKNAEQYSFDLLTTKGKKRGTIIAATLQERSKWMEWILESVTHAFGSQLCKCYTRASRVYIKEGFTREWQMAWILLQDESKKLWISYVSTEPNCSWSPTSQIICEDLRKVRSISKVKMDDGGVCSMALQPGTPIVVNWKDHNLYIQSDLGTETDNWMQLFRLVALQSGASLEDHQLTADDVPVLVECCIKFIETYGMLTEGIYRRSGVQSKINRLLNVLQVDAWNAHISNEEYTEHDVANVLKRFFRTLPEPLLTNELYSQWISGLNLEQHEEQLDLYKTLLQSLPYINRQTLRKLLGHLHAVQNKCEKNLMSVSNLAALWGPNLMTVENDRDNASTFCHTNAETDVVLQLIQYYPWLFDVDREQLAVNDAISEIQERLEQGTFARKNAGDIRTWITHEIINEDISVEIGPRVKVDDVIPKLLTSMSGKWNQKSYPILMEVVCNGQLKRPLHNKDLLLPAILKWAEWSEADRKNNQLIFSYHPLVEKLLALSHRNLPAKSIFEIYYASPKTKSFRQCPFEFCQARFTLLKDLKNHTVQGRWDLESIIWYLGSDSKRTAPSEWCLTFIEQDGPLKKNRAGFGHCLSFPTELDYWIFLTSLIFTQFEGGIQGFITTRAACT